jgi:hypothetical protein
MQIQINIDDNLEDSDKLGQIETEIGAALSRFSNQLTRLEIHLSDVNAGKSSGADKRCMLAARPAGQQPVAVTHRAATLGQACSGAVQKLKNLLESQFGRQTDHKGGATIRHGEQS